MKKAIMSVFALLLLAQSAYALTGYIQPAKIILRTNITSNTVNMINSSINLENDNNIPVMVNLSIDGLNGEFQQDKISLNPNETKTVGFTIILTQGGSYTGSITASYSATQGLPISLSCDLLVYATANSTYQNNYAPSKPNLISPLNNSSTNGTLIDFTWSASTDQDGDTVSYIYQIDNGNFSSPKIQGSTFGTEKNVTVGHGEWYWRVIASDGAHNTSSDVWQLLINNPPSVPQLLSPSNHSVLNNKPILSWTAGDIDGDAITFDLVVGSDSNFTSPVINKVVTNSFYDTSSDNLQNGTYCWKVRSNDGFVKSDFSPVMCFTLNLTQSQTPQPTCSDGIQNQGETGVDCGGPCPACPSSSSSSSSGNGGGTGGSGENTGSTVSNNTGNVSNITGSTVSNNTIANTTASDKKNITEEQNKASQPESPTGFVVTYLIQNWIYWLLGLISIGVVISFYIFYKNRRYQYYPYKWEKRWKK